MDHRPEHLQDPALILRDLQASRSALELLMLRTPRMAQLFVRKGQQRLRR